MEDLRKFALRKWLHKFDENFVNHLSGDVEIITQKVFNKQWLKFDEWLYLGNKGQGGHYINKFLDVDDILEPDGIYSMFQLADDIPFKAKVTIKSLKGKKFPKIAESSMFPKNWDIKRIQEEVAYVYENTVAKAGGFINEKNGIKTYEGLSASGFKIKIQLKEDFIINAFPNIN